LRCWPPATGKGLFSKSGGCVQSSLTAQSLTEIAPPATQRSFSPLSGKAGDLMREVSCSLPLPLRDHSELPLMI
jgi:hypothetical protein